jgi:hypothetical protein
VEEDLLDEVVVVRRRQGRPHRWGCLPLPSQQVRVVPFLEEERRKKTENVREMDGKRDRNGMVLIYLSIPILIVLFNYEFSRFPLLLIYLSIHLYPVV